MNELKTLFISHANPEDNYFAGWLTAKLLLLGYEVWCDIENLAGGADSWKVIDSTVRNKSIRFLFIASDNSIRKDGTLKELAVADKIRDRGDFIIPLRLDGTSFAQFPPEIIRLKAIDFSENWANGLNELVKVLENSAVPRSAESLRSAILPFWYKTVGVDCSGPFEKIEQYLSNWFEVELPERLFVHIPDGLNQIDPALFRYPALVDQGLLISFADAASHDNIPIARTEIIETQYFIENPKYTLSDSDWIIANTRQKIVQLLNDAFNRFLQNAGLKEYVFSGDRRAFYFEQTHSTRKLPGAKRGIFLTGKRKEFGWHFALEGSSFLFPQPAYSVTYHVVFTRDGAPVPVPGMQHSLRRSLGKDWYNRRWRDSVLAAVLSLSDVGKNTLDIPVCRHQIIRMNSFPLSFISREGYQEPKKDEAVDESGIDLPSGT